MNIVRSDLWLVDFGTGRGREQHGARPAVVVSSDRSDAMCLGLAIVIPGTSVRRASANGTPVPNHLQVGPSPVNGLTRTTYFMTEQMKSVSVDRFQKRLGRLGPSEIRDLEVMLLFMLELPM